MGLSTTLIGQSILYYPSLPSTMDIAKKMVKEGIGEGAVIVAGEQTMGRGRLGRKWLSPPKGSLALSIILRPTVAQLPQLNMVASLAVVQSIEKIAGLKPTIKWPNDILFEGRKISGILIENLIEGSEVKATIVGIGINVELNPSYFSEISAIATSLSIDSGREISRWDTLCSLIEKFDQSYQELKSGKPIYERWLARVETLGKLVRVKWGDTIEDGYVESIETDGSLVLKSLDGSLKTMVAGEVTLHIKKGE
jgi:BirA family biotin operon repressor/biotin-[acetyl-CoA-carboxylase] ligase